ncbi:MAG TPA: tRNA pseudouridine(38-40) synthase TruA [Candidatus Sulfotelmatobacter sp.]|jgi:tRNA pseudouridine38-40 synthase|nr:tRNA pseudouridine(38-40) synthase TruA [Candidatus Sulfotelmatobacter sp.]
MRNIKLTIAYDGTDFNGWQVQPGQPTIQGALMDVLEKLTQHRQMIQAAGRTDAGVHAAAQVVNFKTQSELTAEDFQRAFNALLPHAIRVNAAEEVGPDFHSRWDALAKTYRYRIFRGRIVPPFVWRYVHYDPFELDFDAMAGAARLFTGEHDFSTFAASTGSDEDDRDRTTVRTIYRSEWVRVPAASSNDASTDEWVYVVRGKSFMRHMVRKLVGTLVEVGRGKLTPEDVPKLIAMRDRAKSGTTMPAQGLCLESVEYPDPANSLAAKEKVREVRPLE